MLIGTALIVFRETLEAALFVGVVAAATRHLDRRNRWLSLGVLAGGLGSLALAASMDVIAAWADGVGQDLLSTVLLMAALLLLAWHCAQAPAQARQAVQAARRIGATADAGTRSLWALTGAVALAVLREGGETALFVAGAVSGSGSGAGEVVISVILGLASGAAAGWLLFRGLARVSPKRLFTLTNGLILLLAGGLASQLARTLNQANWLTMLGEPAWDLSKRLPNDSPLGTVLHSLVGYDASPSQMQLLFYLATLALISLASHRARVRLRAADQAPLRARVLP